MSGSAVTDNGAFVVRARGRDPLIGAGRARATVTGRLEGETATGTIAIRVRIGRTICRTRAPAVPFVARRVPQAPRPSGAPAPGAVHVGITDASPAAGVVARLDPGAPSRVWVAVAVRVRCPRVAYTIPDFSRPARLRPDGTFRAPVSSYRQRAPDGSFSYRITTEGRMTAAGTEGFARARVIVRNRRGRVIARCGSGRVGFRALPAPG